jgi:hypothetical protein
LTGLVTAAVPVIIHLLNRRRVKKIKFSSLEFLTDLAKRRMRKINLRRILILALRTLAVVFIVVAFARPTIRAASFLLPGKAPKNVIICLDASDVSGGEIYVVSDFRYNSDSTLAGQRPDRRDVRVFFVPVYEDAIANVSIDRVLVPRKLLRPGEVIRVAVDVTNHAQQAPATFPLELTVDDSRKAEKVINLSPGASTTVTFPISFTKWGTYRCRVSKNHDRLPVDDDRFFMLEVSKSVPVTVIRGRRRLNDESPGGLGAAGGYFYVEKALNPRSTGDGEFVVRTIDEKDITAASLPNRGVAVWVNPQRLQSKRLALLERYVRRGGGLMIFLGNGDRRLLQDERFGEFVGMRAAAERTNQSKTGYTSFQQDHPVFSIFNEEELELLTRTRVTRYVAARGVGPDSVLAYLAGGDPALWECARGKGRILVFAAAPDLESGDVPLSPMFLPLVHTSVSYLASAGRAQRQRENAVGRQLFFDAPPSALTSSRLVIRDPDNIPLRPVVFETPQGETRAICERPEKAGFYRLLSDTTLVAEEVVNLDTRESNITVGSIPGGKLESASVVSSDGDFLKNLQAARQGREIFGLFIFLAAAALVAESILGRQA